MSNMSMLMHKLSYAQGLSSGIWVVVGNCGIDSTAWRGTASHFQCPLLPLLAIVLGAQHRAACGAVVGRVGACLAGLVQVAQELLCKIS